MSIVRSLWVLPILLFAACTVMNPLQDKAQAPLKIAPTSFDVLPGWGLDDFDGMQQAFSRSCAKILKRKPSDNFSSLPAAGKNALWQEKCRQFANLEIKSGETVRRFFEQNFRPYSIYAGTQASGLFTGYYEASLKGSKTRTQTYNVPLYKRPDDLVMVQLGDFRDDLKGRRIAGRIQNGRLKPYESRAEIVAGDWPHQDEVLVWVDDPVDAFFVQIQGSGVVELSDADGNKGVMRIGYAGQNGHVYYAIGRELIKRGHLTKETVSLQTIRAWLYANPDQADEIMNTNQSYVFFQQLDKGGPVGGSNVVLTPGRSLAIDHSLLPYGLPLWVDIDPPVEGAGQLQKLMIAQDTGGAIRGAVRGDVFWGYGQQAESLAGAMKSQGMYWALFPR